ncbi:tetratricopeptide repeat-containing sensor histidine kinase [Lutimonas vermicola]|uniref:histidine kinase n=1 Tax=Lutimonas vermicola TaxID=414288 RepID=A0ABU9KXV7_9FLAO
MKYKFYNFLLVFLVIFFFSCKNDQTESNDKEIGVVDEVDQLINSAKDVNLMKDNRLRNLSDARNLVLQEKNDSSKIKKLLKITDIYYDLNEDSLFSLTNDLVFQFAIKKNDIQAIAEYHWNKGNLFSTNEVLDSAFYEYSQAQRIYKSLKHEYYSSKMEYNMSFIQFRVRNYIQSEIFVISAIEGFKKLNRNRNLYLCYNRLLLLDKEIGSFESALNHYNVAIDYLNKTNLKGVQKESLLNNLSLVYQKQKNYKKSIETLDRALENRYLKSKHTDLYTKLIDNQAYSRFLMGDDQYVLQDFQTAKALRDSLGNEAGVVISELHLAEYYLKHQDSVTALKHVEQAHDIAVNLGLNRDILSSLVLLSKADPSHATRYMNDYIYLNDSLLTEERKVRDKFTRIQFETDGYIAANEELKKQNIWISLTSILALASLSLLFFWYRQRSRNRALILERQQQDANEEIYDLMLKQQNREEMGRIQERIRISEDLHDGALARLFSVRIGLGFLKVAGNKDESKRYDEFLQELQSVEKEIRSLSHDLKNDTLSSKKDFPKLLSELLEEQSGIGRFRYEFEGDSSIAWNLVDEKIKINLYRTAQEVIHNIIKYAECKNVKVSLKRKNKVVELFFVDDGKGFDTNTKSKGIGLKNMKSRAKSIGADISINSSVHKGTKIIVSIPTKTLYHEATTKSTDHR